MKIRTTHLAGVFWALVCVALSVSAALAQSDLFSYGLLRDPTPRSDDPALVEEYEVSVDLLGLRESRRQAIELQLPDGSRYSSVPDKIEDRGENNFLWRGALIGNRTDGSGFITARRGHIDGLLTFPGKYAYELSVGHQNLLSYPELDKQ